MSAFSVFDDAPMETAQYFRFPNPFQASPTEELSSPSNDGLFPPAYSNFAPQALTPTMPPTSQMQGPDPELHQPSRGRHKKTLSTSIITSIQVDRRRSVSPTSFVPRNAYGFKQGHRRKSTASQRLDFIKDGIIGGANSLSCTASKATGVSLNIRNIALGVLSFIGLLTVMYQIKCEIQQHSHLLSSGSAPTSLFDFPSEHFAFSAFKLFRFKKSYTTEPVVIVAPILDSSYDDEDLSIRTEDAAPVVVSAEEIVLEPFIEDNEPVPVKAIEAKATNSGFAKLKRKPRVAPSLETMMAVKAGHQRHKRKHNKKAHV